MNATHPLVAIAEQAHVSTGSTPIGLRTGKIDAGVELFEIYADDKSEATKVQRLQEMAKHLTYTEFADAIKKAKELADATDKHNGFTKPEGAKGQANYGPKRQLVNARMSEAKRIFGVAKQAPQTLKGKGYFPAYNAAREWLDSHGKTWDAQTALTGAQKEEKKIRDMRRNVAIAVEESNSMREGESRADYLDRIQPIKDAELAKVEQETFAKRVETIEKSLRKQFGSEYAALCEACTRILSVEIDESIVGDIQQVDDGMSEEEETLSDAVVQAVVNEEEHENV